MGQRWEAGEPPDTTITPHQRIPLSRLVTPLHCISQVPGPYSPTGPAFASFVKKKRDNYHEPHIVTKSGRSLSRGRGTPLSSPSRTQSQVQCLFSSNDRTLQDVVEKEDVFMNDVRSDGRDGDEHAYGISPSPPIPSRTTHAKKEKPPVTTRTVTASPVVYKCTIPNNTMNLCFYL